MVHFVVDDVSQHQKMSYVNIFEFLTPLRSHDSEIVLNNGIITCQSMMSMSEKGLIQAEVVRNRDLTWAYFIYQLMMKIFR